MGDRGGHHGVMKRGIDGVPIVSTRPIAPLSLLAQDAVSRKHEAELDQLRAVADEKEKQEAAQLMRHLEAFTGRHIERPAEGVNISLTQLDISLTQLPPTLAALLHARSMTSLGPQLNAARRRQQAEMAFASGPIRGLKFGAAATLRGATLCVGPIVWQEGEEEETHRCRAFVDRRGARVQRTIPPHASQNSDFCVCAHRMDLCDDCLPPMLTCPLCEERFCEACLDIAGHAARCAQRHALYCGLNRRPANVYGAGQALEGQQADASERRPRFIPGHCRQPFAGFEVNRFDADETMLIRCEAWDTRCVTRSCVDCMRACASCGDRCICRRCEALSKPVDVPTLHPGAGALHPVCWRCAPTLANQGHVLFDSDDESEMGE